MWAPWRGAFSLARTGAARRQGAVVPLHDWVARRGLVAVGGSPKPMKRFYDSAQAKQVGSAWQVALDGRVVKTPKGTLLELPSKALCEAIAEEWAAQGEKVMPLEMPLTTLGCTAVDHIRPEREQCVERMLPYLETDTLCFEDEGERLLALQRNEWLPQREWFQEQFGVKLDVAQGFAVPAHPEGTLAAVQRALLERDEWELCAMEVATTTAKSLVVAAALLDREDTTAELAFRWSNLEEFFQIERWGLVEGEHDVSHEESLRWLHACRTFARRSKGLSE